MDLFAFSPVCALCYTSRKIENVPSLLESSWETVRLPQTHSRSVSPPRFSSSSIPTPAVQRTEILFWQGQSHKRWEHFLSFRLHSYIVVWQASHLMLSLLAPSSVDALASSTAANPTTPLTASMSSPAAPPVVGTSSTAAAATTSPLPSIRRRRGRLFLSHLFQYIALAYEYICSFLHLRQRRVEPAKVVTASYNNSPPTRTAKRKSQSIPKDPKVSAALQYYKGKTLVLDLDETLVHSVRLGSFASKQPVSNSIKRKKIEVQDDKQSLLYEVYKRPHVDFFLKTVRQHLTFALKEWSIHPVSAAPQISQWYKVVIFTASLAEYADPVIDWLDQDHNVISQRYFRQVSSVAVCHEFVNV